MFSPVAAGRRRPALPSPWNSLRNRGLGLAGHGHGQSIVNHTGRDVQCVMHIRRIYVVFPNMTT